MRVKGERVKERIVFGYSFESTEYFDERMARFLTWLTTKNGKYFTRSCVGIGAFSVFGNYIAIHGPLLETFQEMFHAYNHGKAKPLSGKVQQLIDDVLNDCKLNEEKKNKIKFFNAFGHSLIHAGGTNSPWGAVVGIPFTFEDTSKINFGKLRIQGIESIDWVIDGQDLLKALTLSDNAKKFGLMREIYSCDIWKVVENAAIAALCILIPARFAQNMNARMDAFKKLTLRSRVTLYLICYLCGFVIYRCFKDPVSHISEKECDKLAAETGPQYLDGGIELYQKTLMKNKELRKLMGSRGRRHFDENGNENFLLLMPRLPITKRLDLLMDMKKEQGKTND